MKKHIRLLIENIFDDIYDIDQENNITVEIGDNLKKQELIHKYKNAEGNSTDFSLFSDEQLFKIEPYFDIANLIYNFFNKNNSYNHVHINYEIIPSNKNNFIINIYKNINKDKYDIIKFDMINENTIENFNYYSNKLVYILGNTLYLYFIEFLCLLIHNNIILKNFNYIYSGFLKLKEIKFQRFTYDNNVPISITNKLIQNFPNVFIKQDSQDKILDVFKQKGLKVSINGIQFENQETCKQFYELLKKYNIKKYDCKSYGYIFNEDRHVNIDKIQTEFCIANKFEQYSLTTNKKQIRDLVEDAAVEYITKNYNYDNSGFMWLCEFCDKGKDDDGSYTEIYVEIEFDKKGGKHCLCKLLYNFYKTGLLKLIEDTTPEYYKP